MIPKRKSGKVTTEDSPAMQRLTSEINTYGRKFITVAPWVEFAIVCPDHVRPDIEPRTLQRFASNTAYHKGTLAEIFDIFPQGSIVHQVIGDPWFEKQVCQFALHIQLADHVLCSSGTTTAIKSQNGLQSSTNSWAPHFLRSLLTFGRPARSAKVIRR